MDKQKIRKIILNKRKEISDKEKLSTMIVDKVMNLDIYQKGKVIALYKSLLNEVNTDWLINRALNEKVVLLPKIINDKMVFIAVNKATKYKKSSIGVMEPTGKEYDGKIDLIIIPGVAFDKSLNRLGFGKGYYDQYLRNKNIFKIGLCFNAQLVDQLPIDELDVPMDLVITEKKIIKKV